MSEENLSLEEETVADVRAAVLEWVNSEDWHSEDSVAFKAAGADVVGDVEIVSVDVTYTNELMCDFEFHGIIRITDFENDGMPIEDIVHFFVRGDTFFHKKTGVWMVDGAPSSVIKESEVTSFVQKSSEETPEKNSEEPVTYTFLEREFIYADELLSYISTLATDLWYRGHADKEWELRTGIARERRPSLALENKLRLAFENQTTFLDPASHPLGVAKCTFLMQHHGLPTRLLDWSVSPLTALYFAVCNEQKKVSDACIWVMDPSQINRQHGEKFPYELGENQDKIFTEEGFSNILAIHAPYTNLRMNMQKSEFTLHSNYEPMEATRGAEVYLKEKIIIPHRIKGEVRNRLTALGVTRAALFPDLDNIAQTIKDDILGKPGAGDNDTANENGENQAETVSGQGK